MKFIAGILLLAASPSLQYFQYQRALPRNTVEPGQACFNIPLDVYTHAAPGLTDLRVYHEQMETPFVIERSAPTVMSPNRIAPLNLGLHGEQVVFDAAMPQGSYRDVQLDISAQDFLATVSVFGGNAPAELATTKLGAFTVFDFAGQKLGRSTVLHLPQSDFRYLHFVIAGNVSTKNIHGLSVEPGSQGVPKYRSAVESARIQAEEHFTVIEFETPAGLQVDRIAFVPAAAPKEFSRTVSARVTLVPSGHAAESAEPLPSMEFSGNLLRLHREQAGHRIDEERLTLDTTGLRLDAPAKWSIRIDNRDDAPLKLQSIRAEWLERTLCFEATANANYELLYGDKALTAPSYDYATLFARQPGVVSLDPGPETLNTAYRPRGDHRPFTERHPGLLWVALVGVIAVLAAITLRTASRDNSKDQPRS